MLLEKMFLIDLLIVMYTLLMHIFNTELPGFAQLLYKAIFVQSLCFIFENVVRNQKITYNYNDKPHYTKIQGSYIFLYL